MAVRIFEVTEPESARLTVLESAPIGRREFRRRKQRYAMIGVLALAVPFGGALLVLGVAH